MTKACQPSLQRVNFTYTLVQLIYWSLFAAFAGYQTALLLGRGFTSGQAGVFAAIRCLSGIVAQPLLGGWADRHRAIPLKWILNVCFALALAVNVVFYFTRPGFWGTAAIFVALGALELNAYPLLDSMAVQFINAGMEVNYSLGRGLGSFAYAVSCVVLGRQSTAFGVESVLWTHAALLVLLMAVVACCPTAPVVSHASVPQAEPPHSVWQILRASPSFSLMLVGVFFALTAVMPIVNFMVNIVVSRGGNETHLGLALFLMGASELPAALLFPHLRRRLGSRGTLVLSIVFMAIKPLLFWLTPSLGWVLAVQPVQMPGYGLFTPASVYYANENVSPADRVRGQAVMMMASNGLGGMAGNLAAGYAIDLGGVNAMLALCTCCGAAGVACALAALRLQRQKKA